MGQPSGSWRCWRLRRARVREALEPGRSQITTKHGSPLEERKKQQIERLASEVQPQEMDHHAPHRHRAGRAAPFFAGAHAEWALWIMTT